MYDSVELPEAQPAAEPAATAREVALAVSKPKAMQVPARSATPEVQLYSAELPYWAEASYLNTLHQIGKAFHVAGCFPNVAKPEQVMVVGMMAHERGIVLLPPCSTPTSSTESCRGPVPIWRFWRVAPVSAMNCASKSWMTAAAPSGSSALANLRGCDVQLQGRRR